jgi:hypothetical protein
VYIFECRGWIFVIPYLKKILIGEVVEDQHDVALRGPGPVGGCSGVGDGEIGD